MVQGKSLDVFALQGVEGQHDVLAIIPRIGKPHRVFKQAYGVGLCQWPEGFFANHQIKDAVNAEGPELSRTTDGSHKVPTVQILFQVAEGRVLLPADLLNDQGESSDGCMC